VAEPLSEPMAGLRSRSQTPCPSCVLPALAMILALLLAEELGMGNLARDQQPSWAQKGRKTEHRSSFLYGCVAMIQL